MNRFTSRAQKGFTNHRYIQEVLINVCEKISHCNNNNIGGALLSVDQSRAFDTISHKYMDQVFRFFGFGNEFINIMNTIGTGRTASIIFEDGSLSKPFDLNIRSTDEKNGCESATITKVLADPIGMEVI